MTYVGFSLLMPRSFMNGRRTRFLGYSIVSLIAIILAWRRLAAPTRDQPGDARESPSSHLLVSALGPTAAGYGCHRRIVGYGLPDVDDRVTGEVGDRGGELVNEVHPYIGRSLWPWLRRGHNGRAGKATGGSTDELAVARRFSGRCGGPACFHPPMYRVF